MLGQGQRCKINNHTAQGPRPCLSEMLSFLKKATSLFIFIIAFFEIQSNILYPWGPAG